MKKFKFIAPLLFFLVMITFVSSKCSSSKSNCKEARKENCACSREYEPVCGCNEKTYANACEAECWGITEYVQGECPDKPTN